METGQKVWRIKINKPTEGVSLSSEKEGILIEEFEILGISTFKLVLNDEWFTTFYVKDGRKESYKNYLDEISVRIKVDEKYFANGVFITLYSTKKPSKRILDKMVATACVEIDKKYGFLFGGIKEDMYDIIDNFKIAQ